MKLLFTLFTVLLLAFSFAAYAECDHRYDDWRVLTEGSDHSQTVYLHKCSRCGNYEYRSEYPEGTLYKGMKGHAAEINLLKYRLLYLGYRESFDKPYNEDTFETVKAFQKKYGLEPTGVAYPQTLEKIKEVCLESGISAPNQKGEYYLHEFNTFYYTVEGLNRFVHNSDTLLRLPELIYCIDMYNTAFDSLKAAHPEVKTYMYYVEGSRTLDLGLTYSEKSDRYILPSVINPDSTSYTLLRNGLHIDGVSHLEITTPQQLFDYFYSTDHHWNYKGSYEGYVGCVRLLLGEDEPVLIPVEEKVFPFVFNGSSAKNTSMPVSDEQFTVYLFDRTPEYTSYVNDKKREYNSERQYLNGKYIADTYTDHYSRYYGSEFAKVQFINPDARDRSLLIIGTSYADAVKTMLTAHYSNIISIDPRSYAEEYGEFSLNQTVEAYDIDDILILCDVTLFTNTANAVYP